MKSTNLEKTSISKIGTGPELSMRHLQAELARLDILLRRQITRWQQAGQDPTDAFRGIYISDKEVITHLNRPLGGNWGSYAKEDEPIIAEALAVAETKVRSLADQAQTQNDTPRLVHLTKTFHLKPFEVGALLICLAPILDLRYERIYGYLQDDVTKKRPSVNLALDLLVDTGTDRVRALTHFSANSRLLQHKLITLSMDSNPLSQVLSLDHIVAAWLIGDDAIPRLSSPSPNDLDELLIQNTIPSYSQTRLLALTGPDKLAQQATARTIAAQAERHLLTLNLNEFTGNDVLLNQIQNTLRNAALMQAIPCFEGWDSILKTGAPPYNIFSEIVAYPDMVLLLGREEWQSRDLPRNRLITWLDFPLPLYPQRMRLWKYFLNEFSSENDHRLDTLELIHIAGQFTLTSGQIRDAVATARDLAAQRREDITTKDLLIAARGHSNPQLGSMARKIEPRFDWTDIILPMDQRTILRELIDTVRQRPTVLDEWQVGVKLASSRGVTVLFTGPPGTGKTMAAEIMAGELGLDLYRIDLSGVVSKYIGETEKNLEKIFEEATTSNAILFFDEADALFGKRSEVRDAHDRYANLEISYLLQRMEEYDGVTILATNLRANLDEAFTRRLQFAVEFPFPEEPDRQRIWEALFPQSVPIEEKLDFAIMASRFRFAGGNIRNVIVNAAYLAATDGGKVTMDHLLHGTRRELQKMGRLVDEEDMTVSH
ncbi:MAG: ATP-binding protein [Anaerolineae bacterium]|nr:ATP-binding protein [Anaerolineae bacterium]